MFRFIKGIETDEGLSQHVASLREGIKNGRSLASEYVDLMAAKVEARDDLLDLLKVTVVALPVLDNKILEVVKDRINELDNLKPERCMIEMAKQHEFLLVDALHQALWGGV